MRKRTYFGDFIGSYWPEPRKLAPYFADPSGEAWPHSGGNDEWGLYAEGLEGTEDFLEKRDRVDVVLVMTGYPDLGVRLLYVKWDGRRKQREDYASKGDLRRLGEVVDSMQGTPLSVGLFVPFAEAFNAVKEFIETDGMLPKSIEWIAERDLPPEAFPDPGKSWQ